ncbi:MAG: hypothetical protein AAB509_00480 [Patescibacteria group bacterium]
MNFTRVKIKVYQLFTEYTVVHDGDIEKVKEKLEEIKKRLNDQDTKTSKKILFFIESLLIISFEKQLEKVKENV